MNLRTSLLVASVLSIASVSQAHFLWAYVVPGHNQVRFELAESPGESIVPIAARKDKSKPSSMKSIGLGDFTQDPDKIHLLAPLTGHNAGGATLVYGLHGTSLVTWYAKATTNLASAGASLGLPYEITVKKSGAGLSAKVWHGGAAAVGAKVEAYGPGLAKDLTLTTDAQGEVKLPLVTHGTLVLGAIVVEAVPGTHKGQAYKDKMQMPSVTVPMP